MALYSLPVRVYFQDTDAGGVVYHTNYINFMERARTEWLRDLGFSHMRMMDELGVMFVVRGLQVDYRKPAVLDDELIVTVQLKEVGRSRVILTQQILRHEQCLVSGEVQLVCVDVQRFKPVSVPEELQILWKG